jgi:hypothetical protein
LAELGLQKLSDDEWLLPRARLDGPRIPSMPRDFGTRPRAFVAMPFSDSFGDIYEFGIQRPLHSVGMLCERMDQISFTGDILSHMKAKIETAKVVIADLTTANANVYLEVGYAWGVNTPTILLADSKTELLFDVRGHRCLKYENMRDLEKKLITEISSFAAA